MYYIRSGMGIFSFLFGTNKNSDQRGPNELPKKIEIDLNSDFYKDYINSVTIGSNIKLWGSPHKKNEVRAYCSKTIQGRGLLSVFSNQIIHNFLINECDKFNLICTVIEKKKHSIIASLKAKEIMFSEEGHKKKYINDLQKKYNPRSIKSFRLRFKVNTRLTPKNFNDGFSLCFHNDINNLEKLGAEIYDCMYNQEKRELKKNEIIWLEYLEQKISLALTGGEFEKIIRLKSSGYEFKVEVNITPSDTRDEKELMDYGIIVDVFQYYFNVIPYIKK
jgi:hypothetical protein